MIKFYCCNIQHITVYVYYDYSTTLVKQYFYLCIVLWLQLCVQAALLEGIKSDVIKHTKTRYPSLENSNVSTDKMIADMKVKQNELIRKLGLICHLWNNSWKYVLS